MKKEAALQFVWKVLRPIVEKALLALVTFAIDQIKKFFENVLRERAEQAKAKADAAAKTASEETDPIAAAHQAGKEEAWREIAENYKWDIESLKSEIARLRGSLENNASENLEQVESKEIPKLANDPG